MDEDDRAETLAVWERRKGTIVERVDLLEAAARALGAGGLTAEQRAEAEQTAHRLAGSVGMFGFERATAYTRKIERLLADAAGPTQADAPRMLELVAAIREDVAGPPTI